MFDSNIFKKCLRERRKELRISQEDFAKEIGIARASASYYENPGNDALPNIEIFFKMCGVLGVSPQYLIGQDTCKTPDNEEISKLLGLTDISIEILKEPLIVGEPRQNTNKSTLSEIDTINILIDNLNPGIQTKNRAVLDLLKNYFNYTPSKKKYHTIDGQGRIAEYIPEHHAYTNNDGEKRAYVSTDKIMISEDTINEVFLSSIQKALRELKDIHESSKQQLKERD